MANAARKRHMKNMIQALFAALLLEADARSGDMNAGKFSIVQNAVKNETKPALLYVEMIDECEVSITGYVPITIKQYESYLAYNIRKARNYDNTYDSGVDISQGVSYFYTRIHIPCQLAFEEMGNAVNRIFTEISSWDHYE